jgi:hypothetical protein
MATANITTQTGDIIQDRFGWFFRIINTETVSPLSVAGPNVPMSTVGTFMVLCHADGTKTGEGDPLAARVAVVMARRFTR